MENDAKPKGSAKTYEMLWDCKFCNAKKLLGKTHRFCPNCGAQQDPSWRYFPADAEKVAVEDHVYVGADKICPACGSLSAATVEYCGNCGAPLTEAAHAKEGANRTKADSATFETEDLQKRQQADKLPAQAAAKSSGFGARGLIIAVAVIVLVIGAVWFVFFRTTNAAAYVVGHRWEREIAIEALQPVALSGSCDSLPVAAYGVDRRYEQVSSRSVPDGETCNTRQIDQGDGTFREEEVCQTNYRSEPVYGYVCYYSVNRWGYSRSITTQGDMSVAPYWAEASIQSGNCLGCEREGGRDETYYLIFRGDGDRTFECPVPFNQWQATGVEKAYTVKVGAVLKDVKCDTLQPTG